MVERKTKDGFYDLIREEQEKELNSLNITHSYKDKEEDLWNKYEDYFKGLDKKAKKLLGGRKMKKIMLKPTHPYNSIENLYFAIKKGEVITVDDDFIVNEEVMDVVEIDGKPVKKKETPLGVESISVLLGITTFSNFRDRMAEMDLSYNQIQQVLKAEKEGGNRSEWMLYMMAIPDASDKGSSITAVGMFKNELITVKGINHKIAQTLVDKFETKNNMLVALKDDDAILGDLESSVVDKLKKHYNLIADKVTTKKTMFGGK